MATETNKKGKKRGRPFGNKDLSMVLDAAAKVFAQKGFDGAQIKDIAQKADFTTSLLHYHFENKEDLWKQTITMLGEELMETFKNIESYFKDLKGIPLMKAYNRQFIYFSVNRPEFFKIAFHEIGNESHRAEWYLDEILIPIHNQFGINKDHQFYKSSNISPAHFHSLLVGSANIFFALSFQYKRQFGVDSFDKDEIERYVDFVNETIFARFE